MYGIDLGEIFDISANDIYELLPSLRNTPPLCLCVILKSGCNTKDCGEFASLAEGAICIIKICTFYIMLSHFRIHTIYVRI